MNLYQQLAQIEFSTDCYLSGFRGLNIADFENNTGDWHRTVFWNPNSSIRKAQLLGKHSPITPCDLSPYFGNDGIFEASDILKKMGVPVNTFGFHSPIYAATHARCIADLIVFNALEGNNLWHIVDSSAFDSWMDSDDDKQKVYDLLNKALLTLPTKAKLAVQQWLQRIQSVDYHL